MQVHDDPLAAVRALRRQDWSGAGPVLPQLLRGIEDLLDRESAGQLLGRPDARAALGAQGLVPATVAILASSTVTSLAPLLLARLGERGVLGTVVEGSYNRWEEAALLGDGWLAGSTPQVSLLVLDDEAIFGRVGSPLDVDAVLAECEALAARVRQWVERARAGWGGRMLLTTPSLSGRRRGALRDFARRNRVEAAWQRMNAELLDLGGDPGVSVVSLDGVGARVAREASARTRLTSSQVYSTALLDQLALEAAAVVDAELGRSRKVLLLDLDNTLWGGVIGDDGIAGIKLGGGYPGNAFTACQQLARSLQEQGVLLAVCSKNDDEVARAALAEHPDMVLRPDSFVDFAVDWNPKPDNVARIAERLNLGLDSMVFLDDHPVERALMRQALPAVTTLEAGTPDEYADLLIASRLFDCVALSEEDARRTAMYQEGGAREASLQAATCLEDFLLDLDTRIELAPVDEFSLERVVQLFGKTNQFNLTGRRYQVSELTGLADAGHLVLAVRVADRFGDSGLVAAVTVRTGTGSWLIENMVLSCRVFTRNVEQAVISEVLRIARQAGAPEVRAGFRASPRNGRFSDFYASVGFTELAPGDGPDGQTGWRHDLAEIAPLPSWIRLTRTLDHQNGARS